MHVHILEAYVHICTRYKVSVIKPVNRRTVHRWQWQQQWWCQWWHTADNSWLHRLICYQQMSQQWIVISTFIGVSKSSSSFWVPVSLSEQNATAKCEYSSGLITCFFFLIFVGPRFISCGCWLPLFWTLCDPYHGF